MARSELVIELVKAALTQDSSRVRMLAESIVSEERQKEHHFVADQLASIIGQSDSHSDETNQSSYSSVSDDFNSSVVWRKTAEAKLSDIVLPDSQRQEIVELIREQKHTQELIQHGVEPRSRVLLKGAPGNGKTMLAEVIATELGLPFLVVHYEDVVSSFLGETAGRLEKVFAEATEAPCVLFFDEFDVVLRELSNISSRKRKNSMNHNQWNSTGILVLDLIEYTGEYANVVEGAQYLFPFRGAEQN